MRGIAQLLFDGRLKPFLQPVRHGDQVIKTALRLDERRHNPGGVASIRRGHDLFQRHIASHHPHHVLASLGAGGSRKTARATRETRRADHQQIFRHSLEMLVVQLKVRILDGRGKAPLDDDGRCHRRQERQASHRGFRFCPRHRQVNRCPGRRPVAFRRAGRNRGNCGRFYAQG